MNCLMRAWRQHEGELRGWLRRRLGNPVDAEDALQELFLKALRQRERFCEIINARAWLFEVARNALADRLRLSRDMVELPEDLAAAAEETAPVDSLAGCLPRVLSELSPGDREAITLCDLGGMPQEEYARLKGLSLPGAKSRVQRARKRLRQQLMTGCRVSLDAVGQVSDFVPRPPIAGATRRVRRGARRDCDTS
ncbi:MAG TPA: sigma-70 family RNA polymerase sigma factor [Usitatibacteraceae bacterium]|nr:sigma-70 family RNA polymerase sigma factor [Usitatibacteraceae bacterium]